MTRETLRKKDKTVLADMVLEKEQFVNTLQDELSQRTDEAVMLKGELRQAKLDYASLLGSNKGLRDVIDEDEAQIQELRAAVRAWRRAFEYAVLIGVGIVVFAIFVIKASQP